MKYFTYQGCESDCGFASLKMLLASLSKNKSYLYLTKPEKKSNYTLKDIVNIAEDYGVSLECSRCDESYLVKIKLPCLTMVYENHVVMIKKITKNRIIIYDPGEGIESLKIANFLQIWSQTILEPIDYKNIQDIGKISRSILPLKTEILQVVISFVSVAVLICGFYFLNDIENFLYSFLFLFLFFISQLIENLLISKQLNYFDEHYIPLYFKNKEKCTKLEYENFLNFKRNYFVNSRGVLSSILIAFVITFLLCMNDYRNLLALIILVLVKVLDLVINSRSRKESISQIGLYEKRGLENVDATIENLLTANKMASKTVFNLSVKNLLYMIICFLLSIAMMVYTGNSGCNFVIFHFAIYYMGYKSYSEMLEYLSNKSEMAKRTAQFYDNCDL